MIKNSFRKIYAAFIIFIMVVGCCFTVAAIEQNYGAAETIGTDNSYEVIKDLGILDLSAKYKPEDLITRAELIEYVLRAIGQTAPSQFTPVYYFKDTKEPNWYIQTAVSLSIINGDNDAEFRPKDKATFIEAQKMFVAALGYQIIAEAKGGYPTGYASISNAIRLTSGMQLNPDGRLTKADAVKLTYNAVQCDILTPSSIGSELNYTSVSGQTPLSEYFNIKKYEGIVNGTSDTYLDRESDLSENSISIGGVIYKTGLKDFRKFLGYYIEAYYHTEDEIIKAIQYKSGRNTLLTLKADQISVYNDGYIYYRRLNEKGFVDSGSKDMRVSVSAKTDVIFNGKAAIGWKDFKPDSGYVKLIDNGGNGYYNVLIITSFDTVIVEKVDLNQEIIYDKFNQTNKLELYNKDYDIKYNIVNTSGEALSLTDIEEWNILSVAESDDERLYYIIVSTKEVNGEITEVVNDDEIKIVIDDDGEYLISSAFSCAKVNPFIAGADGTFYLDALGKITSFSVSAANGGYAYLMRGMVGKGFDSDGILIRVYDSDGSFKNLTCASKLKIDAQEYSDAKKAIAALKINPTDPVIKRRLIKYKTNSEGIINEIDLPYTNINQLQSGEEPDSLYEFYSNTNIRYKSDPRSFVGKLNINEEVMVFSVPPEPDMPQITVSESYITDYSAVIEPEEEEYNIEGIDHFVNDQYYDLSAFRSTYDSLMAEVILARGKVTVSYKSDYPLTIVTKISNVVDSKGEPSVKLHGYTSGVLSSYILKSEKVLNDIEAANDASTGNSYFVTKGDIIRVKTSGEYAIAIDAVFDYETRTMFPKSLKGKSNPSTTDYNAADRFLYANAHSVYGSVLRTCFVNVFDAQDSDCENYNIDKFRITVIDNTDGSVTVRSGDYTDIADYKHNNGNYSKVFIRGNYSKSRELIIFK